MLTIDDLEKLNEMKEKGIISQQDFDQQKQAILNGNTTTPKHYEKNQTVYVILAFFTGVFGVHNFYAGRWGRGLAQLLITLLSFFLLFWISYIWAIVNIWTIRTDAKGNEFEPGNTARLICGILGIVSILWIVLNVLILSIGGIAGYNRATRAHQINDVLDYVTRCYVATRSEGDGISAWKTSCVNALSEPAPEGVAKASCSREYGGQTTCVLSMPMGSDISESFAKKTDATARFSNGYDEYTYANFEWL